MCGYLDPTTDHDIDHGNSSHGCHDQNFGA
jgi:hypothetical protein